MAFLVLPFTTGVLLVTDEPNGGGSGIPSDKLDFVSETYIGVNFPQTG